MAPTTAGTTAITIAEDLLIESLSRSPTFHDFTETTHEMTSRAHIYCIEIPGTAEDQDDYTAEEFIALFPCVVIGPPEDGGSISYRHEATGQYWEYVRSLQFVLRFERFWPSGYDEQEAVRDFQNKIGTIMEELINQSGAGDRFGVSTSQPIGPPQLGSYRRYASLGMVQSWRWAVNAEVA